MEVNTPVASDHDHLPIIHAKHTHVVDELTSTDLDTPEQLLTPENSRSETSSNNENASFLSSTEDKVKDKGKGKPAVQRRSTRVSHASLQTAGHQLETPEETDHNGTPPSVANGDEGENEGLIGADNTVTEGKKSSQLRHSIAVMESWDAPDTPVSESSQELTHSASGEADTALPQRTLRKRVGRVSIKEDETSDKDNKTDTTIAGADENDQPLRRSSRRSVIEKATEFLDRATCVLGKRTRDKEPDRRSSLRPRKAQTTEEPFTSTTNEPPAAKKRRVSDSDLPAKKAETEEPEKEEDKPEPSPASRFRIKHWLAHGLYSGQAPTEGPPVQPKNKTSRRRSRANGHRTFLPLPMFGGDRLLKSGRDFQLPFDIFSPLPPGQPKPNEWRKTNKNVFVGEAGSIWRANKNMELSKCLCTEDTGCDENCQNRYMFYECDNGNCGLGPDCGNRSFDELKQRTKAGGKYNIGVEVIKTPDRGYGVRSNRTFEANQIIVEYTGEIITQDECEKRMKTTYKKNECYYLMYFDQNMIIDATRGSIARFVNHSCEPNCRMEKWTVAGKPRMALFAGDRGIMTGEELTYDYNFDPYSQRNVQECRCGSSHCRGVLGPRPREKEQRSKERAEQKTTSTPKKAKTAGTKRKIGNVIDESASRLNKKRRSVQTGVRKAVSRTVSTTRKKQPVKAAATTKKTATTAKTTKDKAKAPAKTSTTKTKTNVKLPKVTAKKVGTTVRSTTRKAPAGSGKATTITTAAAQKTSKTAAKTPTAKTTAASKLNRPSAKTKAKILAAANGRRRQANAQKKDDAKDAVKANAGQAGGKRGRGRPAKVQLTGASKGVKGKKAGKN